MDKSEVYTGQAWEAALVKILLKNKGINVLLRKDKAAAAGESSLTFGAWDTVTVLVSDPDSEKAKQIIAEYEKKAAEDYFQP
ncbi:MAG: DUF2007 domain-containing protein [Bacteroidales bacterium]